MEVSNFLTIVRAEDRTASLPETSSEELQPAPKTRLEEDGGEGLYSSHTTPIHISL